MIALDTETTGLDLYHAARPYMVTTWGPGGGRFWHWDVDPLTRRVDVPEGDLHEICAELEDEGEPTPVVGHNIKFDVTALATVGITNWKWGVTEDTLVAGHVLASNQPHDLADMTTLYLGADIQPYEDRLEAAVMAARRRVQQARLAQKRGAPKNDTHAKRAARLRDAPLAAWRIAEEGLADMPAAGGQLWKADGWLPRAMAGFLGYRRPRTDCVHVWPVHVADQTNNVCAACGGHRWLVLLEEYGNADSEATYLLWPEVKRQLEASGYMPHYRVRVQALQWLYGMEEYGVTVDRGELRRLKGEFLADAAKAADECVSIAREVGCTDLVLPKGSMNDSLHRFLFGAARAWCRLCGQEQIITHADYLRNKDQARRCNLCKEAGHIGEIAFEAAPALNLQPVYNPKAKTARPPFDAKLAIPYYVDTLEPDSPALRFIQAWLLRQSRTKAAEFLDSYEAFGIEEPDVVGWLRLHATFRATGTQLLRRSCSDPNLQQVGKKKETNLRRCFGPAPGREWWSLDYKNLELRIPAYEANEPELIALFERADEPPYYGSEHLLNFSTVYPDLWADAVARVGLEQAGPWCKKEYEDTWYQWCKNGDFAVGYGAIDRPGGTADRAFRRPGSHARLKARFARKEAHNQRVIAFARRNGYVETVPDREVCQERGYPLMVTYTIREEVLPTVPLNFRTQGTAGWIQTKSINRCGPQLAEWTSQDPRGYYMILEVHDELVFDFPSGTGPEPWRTNIGKIRVIQALMEKGGEDIGIPCPVDIEYHSKNWADGLTIKKGMEHAPVNAAKRSGPRLTRRTSPIALRA